MILLSYILLSFLLPKVISDQCTDSHCDECPENPDKCSKCHTHYFLDKTQEYRCYPCHEKCKECSYYGDTSCTQCNDGFYIKDSSCKKCANDLCATCTESKCLTCIPGYYESNGECLPCHKSCKTCKGKDENQCLTCNDGFFSSESTESEHTCDGCAHLCKKCSGSKIDQCEECMDGYYYTNKQCKACDPECKTCSESAAFCTSCKDGLYLKDGVCYKCTENCKECSGPGSDECTVCYDGYVSQYGSCVDCKNVRNGPCAKCKIYYSEILCTECPPGYYAQYGYGDSSVFSCHKCWTDGCTTCIKDTRYCDSCQNGFVMDGQKCLPCLSPCKTCKNDQTTCTDCLDEFYYDKESQQCIGCPENCVKCDSKNHCIQCKDEFYPFGEGCKQCHESCHTCHDDTNLCGQCKEGYFFDEKYQCQKCSEHCHRCNSTTCLSCDEEFYADGSSCKPCAEVCKTCTGPTADDCVYCDPGFYPSSNGVCYKCDDSCSECYGPTASSCYGCAKGYFWNEQRYVCTKCEFNCANCTDLTHCVECQDGFRLYKREGEEDFDCQPCKDRGCKKCELAADQCTECIDGYYQTSAGENGLVACNLCPQGCKKCSGSSCSECADGYYLNGNGACIQCTSPCKTCTSASECLSCTQGHLLVGTSCSTSCSSECLTCEGTANTCTSCIDGYVISGTKCRKCTDGCKICHFYNDYDPVCQRCNDGYYLDIYSYQCYKCDDSCKTCTNYGNNYCSSCAVGYYFTLMNYDPGNYYTGTCSPCNGTNHEHCQQCIENCNDDESFTCSEMPICTKCDDGYYINDKFECAGCDSSCKTCDGPTNHDCIDCNDQYFYNSEQDICEGCSKDCRTCGDGPNICTSCFEGYLLVGTECKACNTDCLECKDTVDYCTKCKDKKYSYKGKCYTYCSEAGEGLGVNVTARECYECQKLEGCIEMNDGCQCDKCDDGYYVARDPVTRFDYCKRCELQNCKKCTGEGRNDCTECVTGYYLNVFSSGVKECKTCESPCTVCSAVDKCTQCIEGYYANSESKCVECHSNCAVCSGTDGATCSKCNLGYYLTSGNKCEGCDKSCTNCTGPSNTECSSCASGFFLEGTTCSKCKSPCLTCTETSASTCLSCIDGNYLSGNECLLCDSPCKTCSQSASHCESCIDGYRIEGNSCQSCPTGCATCTSGSSVQCQTCIDGYYSEGTTCKVCGEGCSTCSSSANNCQTCKGGYYSNENSCIKCAWPCENCTGAGNQTCTSCISGFELNETYHTCDLIPNACQPGKHCDFIDSGDENKNYTTDLPLYEGISNPTGGNGGALTLIDYSFIGVDAKFTGCISSNGGGGGIFIYNSAESSKPRSVLLERLTFKSCKAKYGAAVYIYSRSLENTVKILSCTFESNEILPGSNGLVGGSALYLTVEVGVVSACIFSNNKGSGGAVKINDDFDAKPDGLPKLKESSNYSVGSIIISGCSFEIEEHSDCSLFYASEKQVTKIEVRESVI